MSSQRKKQSAPTVSNDIEFVMRGPLAANWGSEEDHRSRPGSCILDLIFTTPTKVGELVFRNYYTAWVTVLIRASVPIVIPSASVQAVQTANKTATVTTARSSTSRADNEAASWKVAIPRRVLMPFPHQETGSHDVISIAATESVIEWSNVEAMRLLLQQPSPVWRTFHVEEISVMRDVPRRVPRSLGTPTAQPSPTSPSASVEPPSSAQANQPISINPVGSESRLALLKEQTLVALRKSNAPEREGPPPKDFVGLVGYEVQGLLML